MSSEPSNDIQTNKDLGQHWLHDSESLNSIIDLAEVTSKDHILEIGPGPGGLTELLLAKATHVIAVEIDTNLVSKLSERFKDNPKLEVENKDIRDFNLDKMPKGYKVVANIPYYLTANIIRRLSEAENPPAVCVLLIQKEVADRLLAKPGKLSLLGVTTQAYWSVTPGQIVKSYLFTPPPKVDSMVVKLTRLKDSLVPANNSENFFNLINATFSKRRKMLSNSLSSSLKVDKNTAELILHSANIDPTRRPQELSLKEWADLTKAVFTK